MIWFTTSPLAGASNSCPTGRDGAFACPALFYTALLLLLSGCATNSVTTLLKASKQTDAIMPTVSVVQDELKARAFEIGTPST